MGKIIWTNKYNLPQPIVAAAKNDAHRVAGDISCSELIDSPRIRVLKRLHDHEVDVSERLDAMMGTALHGILEQSNISDVRKQAFILTVSTIKKEANKLIETDKSKSEQLIKVSEYLNNLIAIFFPEIQPRYELEKTMSIEIEPGFRLYGTFDLFDTFTGFIHDYKSCSVYKWLFPESRKQWFAQLNVYGFMLRHEGYTVNGLRVNPFFKDWSVSDKMRNADYPEARIMEIPVELRSQEEIGAFIAKRVKMHRDAEHELPLCSAKDRWAKASSYVVKETGGKRAINGSVKGTEEEARGFVEENAHKFKKKLFIEHRPGSSLRCERYCVVSSVCEQYKAELAERKKLEENN